jgi:hypothetical protein
MSSPLRTSTSSVVGGAGLLHPRDVAEVGRGQDRDAVAMGDRGRCSVGRSSSERRGDLELAQAQRRGTQQTIVAARLDDRARRSSSQCFRRRAAAPARKQPPVDAAADDCFARRDVADRTIALATTESPARRPADERSAMNAIVAVEVRRCASWTRDRVRSRADAEPLHPRSAAGVCLAAPLDVTVTVQPDLDLRRVQDQPSLRSSTSKDQSSLAVPTGPLWRC